MQISLARHSKKNTQIRSFIRERERGGEGEKVCVKRYTNSLFNYSTNDDFFHGLDRPLPSNDAVLTENGQSGVFLCVIIRSRRRTTWGFVLSWCHVFAHVHGWKCRSRFLPFLRPGYDRESSKTTPNEKKWLPPSKVFHHSNDDSWCVLRKIPSPLPSPFSPLLVYIKEEESFPLVLSRHVVKEHMSWLVV